MTDAPERIYLQWIPEGHPAADEITWCIHEINDEDIKYIRTDIADKRIAEYRKEIIEKDEEIRVLEKYIEDHNYKTILDYMEKYLEGDIE